MCGNEIINSSCGLNAEKETWFRQMSILFIWKCYKWEIVMTCMIVCFYLIVLLKPGHSFRHFFFPSFRYCFRFAHCWPTQTLMILWCQRLPICTRPTRTSMRPLQGAGPRSMPWASVLLGIMWGGLLSLWHWSFDQTYEWWCCDLFFT